MSEEFDYFRDRNVGKLFDLLLQLTTDLHVTTQRLHAMEALLVRRGVLTGGELDAMRPTEDEQRVLDGRREAAVAGLMRIITESGPAERPLRDQWESTLRRKAG
ncbi:MULTISPECIES: hypothetical protein [Streptomyces]|uniref:hypothetical protein n=1 Tax=Streptomyces TaxID=1883 RepID=UPI00081B5D7C|nr:MULTISPECIES: hypothetical protein [unclassified Streptomyces]MYQ50011.1 hypothetical protein [Streptomyces sp. SID4941]SCD31716.1 hypothetical protein GA0115247_102449 [Streptomyces sp. PalvLS-984]SDC88579.1 hypothetical protein F558DRAFT_02784 [Streptomyces sp. AmelKG-A3]